MKSDSTDNNLVDLTSISHDNLVHNDGIINNDDYDNSFVGSGIPRAVSINISQASLSKDPYAKFKFPRTDPDLSEAGKMEISSISSLEYICNLFCGKLEPGLKKIWDNLAGRDVSIPEISKSGMQMTAYDLRKQCSDFRKVQEKESYVKNLSGKLSPETLNPSSPHLVDIFTTELLKNVPKFQTPSEGLLFDFLQEHDTSQKIIQKLDSLINDKQFDLLWILLGLIETHMIFKKYKKKVQKFVTLLKKGVVHQYKSNYYLRFISRAIMQTGKMGSIRIEIVQQMKISWYQIARK